MSRLFRQLPDALRNTLTIAERCSFDPTKDLTYRFPDYAVPPGFTPLTYLEQLCHAAAVRRYGRVDERVEARLREEFRLIGKHNLAGFLLIYRDIIELAREVQVDLGLIDREVPIEEAPPGRGRGSSVAMIVGYLIGMSHIDPLQYDLTLERFLPEDMTVVPDIDLDFPRNIREELIKRVHAKWGWDRAALTGMVSTYKIKGAIRDLGLVLGLPSDQVGKLAKRVEHAPARALRSEMLALPEFRDKVDAPVWTDLIDLSAQLDGFPRDLAQHPGGMVISSTPLIDQVPVQPSA
ncbi:MAG: error-prone DNA polymerase, partial [Dehalococcoidia bacterium]